MDFKSALTKVCHDFSKEIIFQRRIISILDDYVAFKDVPYYKLFYKTILNIGDMTQLISQNPNERDKAIYTFLAVSGLDEAKVKSFLTLVSECYYGIAIGPKKNINPSNSSNCKSSDTKIPRTPNYDYSNLNQSNQVRFMEVPIGSKYLAFENALFKRGASLYRNNNKEVTFLIKDYLYDRDAHITLYISDNPKIVYRINIKILTGLTVDEYRKNFTSKVLNLYSRKYGDNYVTYPSQETIYEWDLDDSEISICDSLKKTVITYRLISDEIRKYEEAIKLDKLRKFQEAEKLKKEQEELKKKREEEAKLLKAKRLFDDI